MKVNEIITHVITKITSNMHVVRKKSVQDCVISIMNGNAVKVTQIGRGILGTALEKHRIKRADRLCSNMNLQQESYGIYRAVSRLFCDGKSNLIIHVDWSDLDNRRENYLLRASIAMDGRGITLYEEVDSVRTKEKRKTHRLFLERLKDCLPINTKPVIVTDAGFKCPWFQDVQKLGWDYVGRIRGITKYKGMSDTNWVPVKQLYRRAISEPRRVEEKLRDPEGQINLKFRNLQLGKLGS